MTAVNELHVSICLNAPLSQLVQARQSVYQCCTVVPGSIQMSLLISKQQMQNRIYETHTFFAYNHFRSGAPKASK